MEKILYRTNSLGELIQSGPVADKVFLAMGETWKAPPVAGPNQVAILNPQLDQWSLLPDYRGAVYYTVDGVKRTITNIGEAVPNDAVLTPPPGQYYDKYDRVNATWLFNFNQCREDLVAKVEMQEGYNQINGITINGVLWDTDPAAHLKYTQIIASINRFDLKNLINGTTTEYEPIEAFQINSTTYVDLTAPIIDVFFKAIEHHLRVLFKWSKASRDTIRDTNNPAALMLLFDALVFEKYQYDVNGDPIHG